MEKEKDSITQKPKNKAKRSNKSAVYEKPTFDVLLGWLEFAKTNARSKHWEMFVVDQFLKGNQNIKGNPQDNSIVVPRNSANNYPINRLRAIFRAYKNFVVRNKPTIEVTPEKTSDDAVKTARRQNAILKRDNRLNNVRKLNKEWVHYGVSMGVGYRQIGYDKAKKVSIRWSVDPRDMFIGATSGKFEDAPYIIKAIKRTVGYWKNKYKDSSATFSPDGKLAADEYKELAEQIKNYQARGSQQRESEDTSIGYECWYRLFETNSRGGIINKVLFNETGIIHEEETPYTEYPFIEYQAELEPNEIYPDNGFKHLIPIQQLYNLLNKQMIEYNYIVNKGRYQMAKNSGFEVINSAQGQIVRHTAGRPVTSLPPSPINPALQWQITNTASDMQLVSAQNDASLGQTPFAGASGDLVEALQSGDSNQLLELRENFEDALALEAQMILKMYDLFEEEGFVVKDEDAEEETDKTFFAVGDTASKLSGFKEDQKGKVYMEEDGGYLDYTRITSDNQVKVSLTSEFGETRQARLNFLSKLVGLGLPLTFLLKYLEFPNVDDIEQRIAEEAVVQKMQGDNAAQAEGGIDVKAEEDRIRQMITPK